MTNNLKKITILAAAISLASCGFAKKPIIDPTSNFDNLSKPQFDYQKFFDGDLEGFGVVYDANGKMTDTEKLAIKAKWRGKKGVLEKTYENNQAKNNSTWLVETKDGDVFSVVGHGFKGSYDGKQKGNAAVISYFFSSKDEKGNQAELQTIENYVLANENSMFVFVENRNKGKLISKETISLHKIAENSQPETKQNNAEIEAQKGDSTNYTFKPKQQADQKSDSKNNKN